MMYTPDGLQHVVAGGYIHTWSRTHSTCSLDDPPTRQQLASLVGAGPRERNEGSSWLSLVRPKAGKESDLASLQTRIAREPRAGRRRVADHVVGQEHFQLPTYTRHPLPWQGMAWEGRDKKQPNRLGQFR